MIDEQGPNGLRSMMALQLAAAYRGMEEEPPSVDEVVMSALAIVVNELRERANDMATCHKADECKAMATYLRYLAGALEVDLDAGEDGDQFAGARSDDEQDKR